MFLVLNGSINVNKLHTGLDELFFQRNYKKRLPQKLGHK